MCLSVRIRVFMDEKYFAKKIEEKWQKKWAESGAFQAEIDDDHVLLEPGDVLHLKATIPHRWENAAHGPSRMCAPP